MVLRDHDAGGTDGAASDGDDDEAPWCTSPRERVALYLAEQRTAHGLAHGAIGDWPAWHVAPYVSVWAVESVVRPGWVGWWVIAGDLPTDYVTAGKLRHPRAAVQAIAQGWLDHAAAERTASGTSDMRIGDGTVPAAELLSQVEARAHTLLEWVRDDTVWESG